MTDLEMARLCAEGDDAQCFALVEKLHLQIWRWLDGWVVVKEQLERYPFEPPEQDLRRAICQCVVELEQAKHD